MGKNNFLGYAFSDRSTALLIFSNIITIIFAIIENWNLSVVIFVFLCQTGIIGFFAAIKVLSLKTDESYSLQNGPANYITFKTYKVFAALVFLIVLYIVLWLYFNVLRGWPFLLFQDITILFNPFVIFSCVMFFVNHLYSFYYNKDRDSLKKNNIIKIFWLSVYRLSAINVGIFVYGLIFIFVYRLPLVALVIFLFIKTVFDVKIHILEHR